eukprot:3451807-Pyramimonas_sp.AAC.1
MEQHGHGLVDEDVVERAGVLGEATDGVEADDQAVTRIFGEVELALEVGVQIEAEVLIPVPEHEERLVAQGASEGHDQDALGTGEGFDHRDHFDCLARTGVRLYDRQLLVDRVVPHLRLVVDLVVVHSLRRGVQAELGFVAHLVVPVPDTRIDSFDVSLQADQAAKHPPTTCRKVDVSVPLAVHPVP